MSRKQRRAGTKKERIARKKLESIERSIQMMPDRCSTCNDKFNPSSATHVDSWRISISESGEILLSCSDCP